jgi:hypothetical protein
MVNSTGPRHFIMARYSRRREADRIEHAFQGIFYVVVLAALAVGGLGHFVAAFKGLVVVAAIVLAGAAILAVTWKSPLQTTTKVGLSSMLGAILVFWFFTESQPPIEWPAVDVKITRIAKGAGNTSVTGMVRDGVIYNQIVLTFPPSADLPQRNQDLRIYCDPENPSNISLLPRMTDGHLEHVERWVFAIAAFLGGIVCLVISWRRRLGDDPIWGVS